MFYSAIPVILLTVGLISFATALIGLPLTLALLILKKPYRYRISTYILFFFGVMHWGMLPIPLLAFWSISLTPPLPDSFMDMYLVFPHFNFFVPAAISLVATQAPRKEYLRCFFIFLLPVLLFGLVSVFYPFPLRDEFVAGAGVSSDPDMKNAPGYLSVTWAFACFCWYCIWRIWRIRKKEQAAEENPAVSV